MLFILTPSMTRLMNVNVLKLWASNPVSILEQCHRFQVSRTNVFKDLNMIFGKMFNKCELILCEFILIYIMSLEAPSR